MRLAKIFVILCIAAATSGCGIDWEQEVKYDITCDTVTCDEHDEVFVYTDYDGYRSKTCIWHCANSSTYVSIDFVSINGACWEVQSEFYSDGICGY